MRKLFILFFCVYAMASDLAIKCKENDYSSCTNLAISLINSDIKRAKKLLALSCEKDVALACHRLSMIYFNGAKKNTQLAKELANKACDLGYLQSCHNLGNIYKYSLAKTKQDFLKAINYYEKNCDKKYANSCYELANLYQYYLPINDDYVLLNHSKACDLDLAASCYQIGYFAYFKKYNLNDLKLALKYFLKTCELNYNLACMMSANIYEKQNNLENALKFYKKACDLRNFTSCNNYERIKDKK